MIFLFDLFNVDGLEAIAGGVRNDHRKDRICGSLENRAGEFRMELNQLLLVV